MTDAAAESRELRSEDAAELRRMLPHLLSLVDRASVADLAERLAARHRARHVEVPAAGLGLVQGRDTVQGLRFGLTEAPMSRAVVELGGEPGSGPEAVSRSESMRASGDGSEPGAAAVRGGAVVMADDAEYAGMVAVLDGVLGNGLEGAADVASLARRGRAVFAEIQRRRAHMREATRTDFSLLGDAAGGGPRAGAGADAGEIGDA